MPDLLIELDGNHEEVLMADAEQIMQVLEQFQCGEILFADAALGRLSFDFVESN